LRNDYKKVPNESENMSQKPKNDIKKCHNFKSFISHAKKYVLQICVCQGNAIFDAIKWTWQSRAISFYEFREHALFVWHNNIKNGATLCKEILRALVR
jgi:hypothetical protein